MQNPCIDHCNVVICILRYLKEAPRQGLLYEDKGNTQLFEIVMLIGLVLWTDALLQDIVFSLEETLSLGKARKKQNVVAVSFDKSMYRVMASLT